jgi:glycosyltransferase involved in cell wall biosynthesis
MKILHVIHSVDPRSGGPSHAIRELVRAQVDQGHDVSLLATTVQSAEPWLPPEQYARRIGDDPGFSGADVMLASAYGRRRPWSRFSFSPQSRRWLKRHAADPARRPDVVHTHGVFSHVTTSASRVARGYGIPCIIRPAGALDAGCLRSGRRRLKRLFFDLLLDRDLRRAAFLHATSEAEARDLSALGMAGKVRTVPLGVRPVSFDPSTATAPLWKRFPKLRGRRVVLFLSRVAPIKRPELLVEAVARVRRELPDLILLIAGHDAGGMAAVHDAVDRHNLREHVVFSGFLEGAEKLAAYAVASVFVLPSGHENFGVAVAEAMAHGVPVVVTEGVASHVYIDEAGCGRTVDANAEALSRGLRDVLSSDREALGNRGREYVAEHLTWSSVVQQLDELYREAIAQR